MEISYNCKKVKLLIHIKFQQKINEKICIKVIFKIFKFKLSKKRTI